MPLETSVLNKLPFSIYWLDIKNKILKGGNTFFINHLDKAIQDNFIGKSIVEIFNKEKQAVILRLIQQSQENNYFFREEFYKDTRVHDQLILLQCCAFPKENLCVFVEILSLKDNKIHALYEEKEKLEVYLHNLVNFIPASIYWKDKEGVILGGSRLHAKLAGYNDPKEVIGKKDSDFVWRNYASDIWENDRLVMQDNQTVNFEEMALLDDKKIHTFLTNKFPLKDKSGNSIGVLGVSIDITPLKEAQKSLMEAKIVAEEANQAKTIFLANMSHDIRNPLTTIISLASFYQKNELGESAIHFGSIASLSKKLLELLNDILKSSAAGNFEEKSLHKETFSLKQFLDNLQAYLLPMAKQSGLDFILELDTTLSDYFIICDKNKLYRILFNLLNNAVKFTKTGHVHLKVSKIEELLEKQAVVIQFSVADTGPGIAKEKQPFIFDNLFRINQESNILGNGVGLYIVNKFIHLLGSTIQLNSTLNKGSTFYFSLTVPFQKGYIDDDKYQSLLQSTQSLEKIEETKNHYQAEVIHLNKKSKDRSKYKKKVLLIDDDIISTKVAKLMLMQAGFRVFTASNAVKALDISKKNQLDFIVTDLNLDKISGQEFVILYRYWERKQNKNVIPIFALTSLVGEEENSCKELDLEGFNSIWPKPISEKNIKTLLSYTIDMTQNEGVSSPMFYNKSQKLENLESESTSLSFDLNQIKNCPLFFLPLSLHNLGEDQALQKELLSIFRVTLAEEIKSIQKSYQDKNFNEMYNLLHTLKGSTGYVGAIKLDKMCKFFLDILQHYKNDPKKITKFYPYLEEVLFETLQEIQS